MKSARSVTAILVGVSFLIFLIGFRLGKSNGYNTGFKDGCYQAEEYAKECYNNADYRVKDVYGISAYDAGTLINKYEGEYLFTQYGDVVNAYYALGYFYDIVWDELINVSEITQELSEIS